MRKKADREQERTNKEVKMAEEKVRKKLAAEQEKTERPGPSNNKGLSILSGTVKNAEVGDKGAPAVSGNNVSVKNKKESGPSFK
ncbi:MAG: hypothetical protein LBI29_02375 [Rickettsiales bacterium]|jgi:hypothetical protein|nr:hypothetical protein [Rickettsiales bacterium]